MKKAVLMLIGSTMMASVITCCSLNASKDEPDNNMTQIEPPADISLTRAEERLVNCNNQFAFNLFRQISATEGYNGTNAKSVIVSPLSITYALGMLNNGAANNTQAQINEVLGFGDSGADSINSFCSKIISSTSRLDPNTKLMIANTIYLNKGYNLKTDFLRKAESFYQAQPQTRDFHDGKTLDVINRWAGDNTEQMIQEVLDEQSFDPSAVSYLLNAIYFKGLWEKQFDKSNTVKEKFFQNTDDKADAFKSIPMMHQTAQFKYAETDDLQALCMPYGNGAFQMTILLPKQNNGGTTIFKLPEVPESEEWDVILRSLRTATVDVKIPRFETSTDIDLKTIMASLGMSDAFDSAKADFRNFCDKPTYIGLMKQVAKIKMDEEGTEASAVTVIGMKLTSLGPSQEMVFHANHPFLYVISERSSGLILFMGQYTGN